MKQHTIAPGDWIGALAKRFGFEDPRELWEHSANASLRQSRTSPELLLVGDVINIPEPPSERGIRVLPGRRYVFVVQKPDLLRIRMTGVAALVHLHGPLAYTFKAGESLTEGVVEQEGQVLELPLVPSATTATLELEGLEPRTFDIGGLGPASSEQGAQTRLLNLGYGSASSAPGGRSPEDSGLFRCLQSIHGLKPTGILDDATVALIEGLYGV